LRGDTAEAKMCYSVGVVVAELLDHQEEMLRVMAARQEAADAAARPNAEAAANMRRQVQQLEKLFTRLRLTRLYGQEQADKVLNPTILEFDGLTEEQMKALKEVQKESEGAAKAARRQDERKSAAGDRGHPYRASGEVSGVRRVMDCFACGKSGHWAREGKCKPADLQAKAYKDMMASMQRSSEQPSLPADNSGQADHTMQAMLMMLQQAASQQGKAPVQPPPPPPQPAAVQGGPVAALGNLLAGIQQGGGAGGNAKAGGAEGPNN